MNLWGEWTTTFEYRTDLLLHVCDAPVVLLQPFIYVENVGGKGAVVRAAQELVEGLRRITGGKSSATRDLLPFIQVCYVECGQVFKM